MTGEQSQILAQAMITLWQREFPATLRVLGALKDDAKEYRPHPKSRSAWELGTHLATADVWFIDSIAGGRFEWDREAAKQAASRLTTVQELTAFYGQEFPSRLASLGNLSGGTLAEAIDFFGMMKMTRAEWIGFANNHSVHHRGQLSAYLRSMGAKVPDIYGPSADSERAAD
jgi:uncharacterized damage-inducible protein DinB